MQGRYKTCIRC
ncbi:Uncharacterized protein APZ42_017190 [Daphnia magna]|uniref:Uncharacterized protein n=1 Tax=Daphnia magna TaxID=35525 RepID=A0A164ZR59_9CRUS|nr:Uncharacterized protein APZ42_017190 [Daphnia magna]